MGLSSPIREGETNHGGKISLYSYPFDRCFVGDFGVQTKVGVSVNKL